MTRILPDQTATALILGAAVWPGGAPSPALERRTRHAITLYQQGRIHRIIPSGGLCLRPPCEAQVMADLCRASGIPDSALTLETAATSTLENIAFAKPLLGGQTAVIVTDRYHAPRAWLAARAYGLDARVSCPPLTSVWPSWRLIRQYLREAIALPFYALKLALRRNLP